MEGREEFIWVGSTEPKANLYKSNNGAERSAKRRRLMASLVYISQHKQLWAAAFVRLVDFFSFSSSFGSSVTMQVLVLLRQVGLGLFAVRMSVVYRREQRDQMEDDCPPRPRR